MKFIRFTPLEVQSSLEYWTAERMANAMPDSLIHIETPKGHQQKDDEFSQAETEMSFCGFESGRCKSFHVAKVNVANDPYRKAGRLYYTKANGKDAWTTAQFVGADNIILTAAHCLKYPRGKWSSNIIFSRACIDTEAAQDVKVAVTAVGIPCDWDSGIIWPHRVKLDYGFAKTTPASDVGYLTLLIDLPDKLKSIGYTNNFGNHARYMCKIYGTQGEIKNNRVQMKGNFLNFGSSGGAWFPDYGSNEIVGLNSASYGFGDMYGPIFDCHIMSILERVIKEN